MTKTIANATSLVQAYTVGDWHVVPAEGVMRRDGADVRLTLQQMKLLELLIAHPGQVLSKETIFGSVWEGVEVEDNALPRCISEIRRALGDDAKKQRFIQTLPKRGYRLIAPVRPIAPSPPPLEAVSPAVPSPALRSAPAAEKTPTLAGPSRARRPPWAILASVALLAGATLLVGSWLSRGHGMTHEEATAPAAARVTSPASHRTTVAVLALTPHTSRQETDWLAAALAEMLTTEVAASEDLAVVPRTLIAGLRHEMALSLAADRMDDTRERLQRALGVDYVISGTYLAPASGELGSAVSGNEPGLIRLDLRIWESRMPGPVRALAESGSQDRLPDVISAAGRRLRTLLGAAEPAASGTPTSVADQNAELIATRHYVEALAALRRQEGQAAVTLLERAITARPNRPLIHLALSESWALLGYRARAQEAAAQAMALAPSLPRDQRRWVQAHVRERQSAWPEAIELYRALWTLWPENHEYGLRLARTQTAAGQGEAALETVEAIRAGKPEGPPDPRLDLAASAAHALLGNHQEALAAGGRATALATTLGAELAVAKGSLRSASALYALGRVTEARAAIERARDAFAHAGAHRQLAQAQGTLAAWLVREGDFGQARALAEAALAVFRRIGDRAGEAKQLRSLADLWLESGDFTTAEGMLLDAIAMGQEIGSKVDEAASVKALGVHAARAGRYDDAASRFAQALDLYRQLGNREREGTLLVNLAKIHMFRNEWQAAVDRFDQAEPILRATGSERALAQLQSNLGAAHAVAGNVDGAARALTQAVEIYRRVDNPRELASNLSNLGEVLIERDDLPSARARIEEALTLRRTIGEPTRIANSQIARALVLLEMGQPGMAEQQATVTAAPGSKASDQQRALSFRLLARAHLDQDRPHEARRAIRQAVDLLQSERIDPDALCRFWIPLTRARVDAAHGELASAARRLEKLLSQTARLEIWTIHAEARLALAEVEIASGAYDAAAERLADLIKDAQKAGWDLLASKARVLAASRQGKPRASNQESSSRDAHLVPPYGTAHHRKTPGPSGGELSARCQVGRLASSRTSPARRC